MSTYGYDNSPSSWELRDRYVTRLAARLAESDNIDTLQQRASEALGYLTIAANAGQLDRLREWALAFDTARDAAYMRLTVAS